jgi:hypothetical protein
MLDIEEKLDDKPSPPPGSSYTDSSPHLPKALEATYSNSRQDRSISRTRSNNGYGCDGGTEDNVVALSGNDLEGRPPPIKDPFEVHWDGGDSDPMNPRSLSMARKWVVVLILSAGSVCV